MWFFVRIRSFNGPSFLSHVSGLADVNYTECHHACSLGFRATPCNLGTPKLLQCQNISFAYRRTAPLMPFTFTLIRLLQFMV